MGTTSSTRVRGSGKAEVMRITHRHLESNRQVGKIVVTLLERPRSGWQA